MARKENHTEIFLLPLFVENLRESLKISQEKLQELYLQTLHFAVREEASNFLQKTKDCIDQRNENSKIPNFSVLRRPPKKTINYYVQLKDAKNAIEKGEIKLSKKQYDKIQSLIKKSLDNIESSYWGGSGRGTEIRKIRDILNIGKAPSKDKHDELMFILEQCYPKLFSDKEGKYSAYFRKQIVCSPDQIMNCLFSVDNNLLPRTPAINTAIQLLMTAKRDSFGKSSQGADTNKVALKKAYSELFSKLGHTLSTEYKIAIMDERQSYYIDDTAAIGVAHAKSILYLISGLDVEVVDEKWMEISENVFQIVVKAGEICEKIYKSPMLDRERLSKDMLFEEEFIILFLNDKRIRAVINDISCTNVVEGCDIIE